MKVLISGATGLVGCALVESLRAEGHAVARLVRPGGAAEAGDIRWDPAAGSLDVAAMEGADAVVNLSGSNIAGGRWTARRKAELRSSRVDTTRLLVDALSQLRQKPRAFLSASATGIYGNRADEVLTEDSEPGTDFLAMLARDWEAEARRAEPLGIRTVLLRFGVILARNGGALPLMLLPFRFGVGGRLGSGRQWFSWITLEDSIAIVRAAIVNDGLSGPVNVVAPNPVQNAKFTRIVAKVLRRPAIFPTPAFALRAVLGEMADALLLASQRVRPERLLTIGHRFRFEDFSAALRAILDRQI